MLNSSIQPDDRLPYNNQNVPHSGISSRRKFLRQSSLSLAGIILLSTGCKEDEKEGVYLGTGDVGILNYLYAFEQMEAGFYGQVTQVFYSDATDSEKLLLTDIRDHGIAHREFFKAALGDVKIPLLDLDFSTVSFGNKDSVLSTAKTLKDLAVSAYNGAGPLMVKPDFLTLVSKIVSVKARHAAVLRNVISYGSFANSEVIGANGLDRSMSPSEVLAITGTYIKSPLNAEDLPII